MGFRVGHGVTGENRVSVVLLVEVSYAPIPAATAYL